MSHIVYTQNLPILSSNVQGKMERWKIAWNVMVGTAVGFLALQMVTKEQ